MAIFHNFSVDPDEKNEAVAACGGDGNAWLFRPLTQMPTLELTQARVGPRILLQRVAAGSAGRAPASWGPGLAKRRCEFTRALAFPEAWRQLWGWCQVALCAWNETSRPLGVFQKLCDALSSE